MRSVDYDNALFDVGGALPRGWGLVGAPHAAQVAWSESNEHQILTASGDGTVQLWDLGVLAANPASPGPIRLFRAHGKDAVAVRWSLTRGDPRFLSAGWDGAVRLWDPARHDAPLASFEEHPGMAYEVAWAPRTPEVFGSVAGDGALKVWDARSPPHSVATYKAHDHEALSVDWSKCGGGGRAASPVGRPLGRGAGTTPTWW